MTHLTPHSQNPFPPHRYGLTLLSISTQSSLTPPTTPIPSHYYLKEPYHIWRSRPMPPPILHFMPHHHLLCPCYAPFVPQCRCRFCGRTIHTHRKYYIFSMHARRIQMRFLRRKYARFVRQHIKIFKRFSICRPVGVNVYVFGHTHWRRWSEHRLFLFLHSR